MTMRSAAIGVAALLAGCGSGGSDERAAAAPADFTPPKVQAPTPLPGLAQTVPLTAYVGRYANDAVGGVAFFDRTEVANALAATITDAGLRRRIIMGEGPRTPIFAQGGRVAAHGCAPHDCAAHHWTVLVPVGDGISEVCYYHAATTGAQSRWFTEGVGRLRPGTCPTA